MPKKNKEKKAKGGNGAIVIKTKKVVEAINTISKILDNKADTVQIEMREDGMLIAASIDSSAIQVNVPECSGKGKFAVGIDSFRHIMAGHDTLECSLTKSDLAFRDGDYDGTLKVIPHMAVKVEGDNEVKTSIDHDSGLMSHFNSALKNLNLTMASVQDSDENFIVVKVHKKEIICAVYDTLHAGLYRAPVNYKGPDLLFNFKTNILRKVIELGNKGDDYSLNIGSNIVFVDAGNIKASINMTQIEAKSFDLMLMLMADAEKNITASATIDVDTIDSVITNMKGIFEADKVVNIDLKDKKLGWHYETTYGKVGKPISVKSKGKASIRVRLPMIEDVVGSMPSGEIDFGIVDAVIQGGRRSQVYVKAGNLAYLVSGTQKR